MSSMQEGSYSAMIDNIVKFYSGYIQVHDEEYWDNKTINNTFIPTDSLEETIKSIPEITNYTPRLEFFALASSEEITKGSVIIGIDPVRENQVTEIGKWVSEGDYLKTDDDGLLVGSELARYLQLSVGDTLVVIGQGYHGVSAAGKYPIRGILEFPSPELNKQTIYMEIQNCQEFFTCEGRLTSLVLMIESQYQLPKTMKQLKSRVGSPFNVMSWDEMHPDILQMIEADRDGGVIMKAILYIIIGFGIFGTIMMLIMERKRELGVMIAIGMQRYKLAIVLFFETIYIGFIGVLAGFAASVPVIAYYYRNPIHLTGDAGQTYIDMGFEPFLYFSWLPSVFYDQVLTVFFITAFIAIYPMISASRMKIHLALRA
jgi:ABC-type lipoprotein release transport system permease subunit